MVKNLLASQILDIHALYRYTRQE